MFARRSAPVPLALLLLAAVESHAQAPSTRLPTVTVHADRPSEALGLPESRVATSVHRVGEEALVPERSVDITEGLARAIPGVQTNPVQSNRFQRDLLYRGFTASPILGSPIGLSVYLDGARWNEGFGDTVNWDLVPEDAVERVELISGPEALFGRNSLAGTLFLETKSGFSFEGTRLSAAGGADHTHSYGGEHGGSRGSFAWYFAGNFHDEDEWRDESGTRIRRGFGKLSYRGARAEADLSLHLARNDLTGSGFVPERVVDLDSEAVYTFPDDTGNELAAVTLAAKGWWLDHSEFRLNAFFRDYERNTRNGDAELECDGADVTPARCELAGGELESEAEDRRSRTETTTTGARGEWFHTAPVAGLEQTLRVGLAVESSRTRFTQDEAEADFFAEGHSLGVRRTGSFEEGTAVATDQRVLSLYARELVELTERLSLTAALRFEHVDTRIRNRGSIDDDALEGSHTFHRVTPGVGLVYRPREELQLFGSYRQGWRVPTPAELTCADPDDPCNLPNAFVADPPLDPVVAETFELGGRGWLGAHTRWSLALYHTRVEDDLLFVQSQVSGGGFFRNVSRTRRQGVELALEGRAGILDWFANYHFLDARYDTSEILASPVDPFGVVVEDGDRIPGISRHMARAGAEVAVTDQLDVGCDALYASGQYLRGDGANERTRVPGHATVDCRAGLTLPRGIHLWARIENLLDTGYEVGGARNFDAFAEPAPEEARFVAPGSPRRVWFGVDLRF